MIHLARVRKVKENGFSQSIEKYAIHLARVLKVKDTATAERATESHRYISRGCMG